MNRQGNWISVISKGRPENVERMSQLVGHATWYVPEDEAMDYIKAGAPSVWGMIEPGLCVARNAALEDAFTYDLACVQLSDDLRRLEHIAWTPEVGYGKHPSTFGNHLRTMEDALITYSAKFAGVAPTNNDFYYNPRLHISQDTFVVGDFIMVKPSAPRFDEELKMKEDYDFTLQHIRHYGTVARCNSLLATFAHRVNKGGVVDTRTEDTEMDAIKHLKGKWGPWIKLNPKRPNEVLLRLPRNAGSKRA